MYRRPLSTPPKCLPTFARVTRIAHRVREMIFPLVVVSLSCLLLLLFFFFYRFLEWSRRVVSFANLSFLIALLFMNDSIILFQREMIFRSFQSLKIQVCRKIERINYFAIKKTPSPWRLSIWHRYIIPRVTFAIVTRGAFTTSSIQRQLRKDPARG